MKIKICTSLEQSKKLIELGIDVYTADMFWKNGVSDKYIQCFTPFVSSGTNIDYDYDIPAWSLTALLDVIPNYKLSSEHNYHTCTAETSFGKETVGWFDTPIDAAFEMVVCLKENKKI